MYRGYRSSPPTALHHFVNIQAELARVHLGKLLVDEEDGADALGNSLTQHNLCLQAHTCMKKKIIAGATILSDSDSDFEIVK
jgi:hypothetical protein